MFASGHAVDRRHKRLPPFLLRRKDLPARRSDPIQPPAPGAGFLHPSPVNPSACFQPIQERVERGGVKRELATGPQLNELRDVVPMPGLVRTSERINSSALPFLSSRLFTRVPTVSKSGRRRSGRRACTCGARYAGRYRPRTPHRIARASSSDAVPRQRLAPRRP